MKIREFAEIQNRQERRSESGYNPGAKEGQRDLGKKNPHLYIEMRTLPYNAGRAYRESPKSARNFFASFSCQSEVGARRPKKKRRLAGSSTNFSPPTSSRLS